MLLTTVWHGKRRKFLPIREFLHRQTDACADCNPYLHTDLSKLPTGLQSAAIHQPARLDKRS